MKRWMLAVPLFVLIGGCGGLPGPEPPEPQPCTPGSCLRDVDAPTMCVDGDCVPCEPDLSAAIWNTDAGNVVCSTPERPVKHWPETEECPLLTEECPSPLPQPQCSTFTDRGGTLRILKGSCDCYLGEDWIECEAPPPGSCCHPPPEGNDHLWTVYTPAQVPTQKYDAYRKATIAVGDRCGKAPMATLALISDELNKAGECSLGPAADSVSIRRDDGLYEEWHAVYFGNGCIIDGPNAYKAAWRYSGTECGPVDPPSGECGLPQPDLTKMTFKTNEAGNHLDTTWTTVNQPNYCTSIGYCCMPTPPAGCGEPGCVPRGGCPVRGEGDPERGVCEAELCDQKWECNGEPVPGWRGNPAQTDCRGHWKTWCSAPGSTAVAEGDR